MNIRTSFARAVGAAGVVIAASMATAAVAQENDTFRFAASSDIRVIDPIWSLEYNSRNHGYLVYDTLFAFCLLYTSPSPRD